MAVIKLPKALNDPQWKADNLPKSFLIQDHLHFTYHIEVSCHP